MIVMIAHLKGCTQQEERPVPWVSSGGGGGTWVLFGWVCADRDSKLAHHSKKEFP